MTTHRERLTAEVVAIDHRAIELRPVVRLSALPEHYVLAYFWMMVSYGCPKLSLLIELSYVRIERPPEWDPAIIRKEHQDGSRSWALDKRHCFSCGTERADHVHHVIQVQYGGSNTARNLVALCFTCHRSVHCPALRETDIWVSQYEFELLRDIAPRVMKGLRLKCRFPQTEVAS
jgi:hypothetical protein